MDSTRTSFQRDGRPKSECGIEGLVEELCMKLKKVQEERDEKASDDVSMNTSEPEEKTASKKDTSKQAERYYEAFPALGGGGKPSKQDYKPKGVWSSVAGSSVLLPVGGGTPESHSACVSRSSTSPTGFDDKKQRTRSLPTSLAPTRQNSFNSGKRRRSQKSGYQNDGVYRDRYRDRQPFIRNNKSARGGRKYYERRNFQIKRKDRSAMPNQPFADIKNYPTVIPLKVIFARPPSQTAAPPTAGQPSPELELQQSLWEERDPLRESENGDFFLEQAVHSMAESICRGIVDEEIEDGSTDESEERTDALPFGVSTSGEENWASTHPLECFGDPRFASVSVVCEDAEVLAPEDEPHPGSIWERDLVLGSPNLPDKGPWLESARSCQQATPSLLSPEIPEQKGSVSEDTSVSDELSVVIDDEPFTPEVNSPRNAPIGTGRGNDTLLRICNHDHRSGRVNKQEDLPEENQLSDATEWPSMSANQQQGQTDEMTSDPPSENIWAGFIADQQQGSLAEGIRSSCAPGQSSIDPASPSSSKAFDLNSALWSTYDTAPPRMQPPKVVTWGETVLSPLVSHLKASSSSFIEGGVYGSPYGSRNTSHYNSCSTSPGNDGSLLDLWGSKEHMQELSAAASKLEEYFSPRPTPGQQPLWSDEQSIIEDSLADSPKFLSSRSSSRFDFAQPASPPNSDRSSPTETDDMVSETEAFEETVRRKEKFVMESALGAKCNIIGKDSSSSNSFISMQDSCRLDANSNINQEKHSPSGERSSRDTSRGIVEIEEGLEKVSIDAKQDTSGAMSPPLLPDDSVDFTPVEQQSNGSATVDGSRASRALQFEEDVSPHRSDGSTGLSGETVQSKENEKGRRPPVWRTRPEVKDDGGFASWLPGNISEDGNNFRRGSGSGMEFLQPVGVSTYSDFTPDVKSNYSDQFFPFEEEVFLQEEGLLDPREPMSYCETCNSERRECQECRSSHESRLSRNSSGDEQDFEGRRHSGSTKVERGSYSSRPPEEIRSKPLSSKPIQITNSR
ncbi:uncharacterized protein [Apostichopus japonicus]|uniref:uncharacterized protein isoform X2 n=1 Tax=Stichopus japonicus TaxID=307972 RepID=UPI003AB78B70